MPRSGKSFPKWQLHRKGDYRQSDCEAMSRTLASVDDAVLQKAISQARRRLVFIPPGIRPPVAQALANAMSNVPASVIHLVLDVDAEVCRLGYRDRDFKGSEILPSPASDSSEFERETDQQVYALYGLTPEEIKIVEDAAK